MSEIWYYYFWYIEMSVGSSFPNLLWNIYFAKKKKVIALFQVELNLPRTGSVGKQSIRTSATAPDMA